MIKPLSNQPLSKSVLPADEESPVKPTTTAGTESVGWAPASMLLPPTDSVGLTQAEVVQAAVDLDALSRVHDGAYADHVIPFFESVRTLGLTGTDVMQRIINDLLSGDAQSALETFTTLQRVIESSDGPATVSGGAAKETRESTATALETASTEANLALEKHREAVAAYQRAMAELEAMQEQFEAQLADLEKELEGAFSATADLPSPGQTLRERKRELYALEEALPVNQDMIAHAEALAAQFASDPANAGYLTREQTRELAATLLAVPKMVELTGRSEPAIQVAPELVQAVVRGFESVADPASVELMSAQLADLAFTNANSSYRGGTLPGHGREALRSLKRSSDGRVYPKINFELPALDAAPVTVADRATRVLTADGGHRERVTPYRSNYEPGDVLTHEIRVIPGQDTEFPMSITGSAGFNSVPVEAEHRTGGVRFVYTLDQAEDGTIEVRRQITDPVLQEPETLEPITPGPDGSFTLGAEFQPPETLESGKQQFTITLGSTRSFFVFDADA